ncbi:MAG: hypothetical protein ACOYUZ_02620 [Patescibacteria group bacterium]
MKWYQYLFIPMGKWLVNTLMIFVFFSYVFANVRIIWLSLAAGWLLSALVAAPFAYFTFKFRIPSDKELGLFILSWFLVTLLLEIVFAFYGFTPLSIAVFRYEFFVQVVFEVIVILVIARVMRRQDAYHKTMPDIPQVS